MTEPLRAACRPERGWAMVVPTLARRHARAVGAYVTAVYGPDGQIDHHNWWVEVQAKMVDHGSQRTAVDAFASADLAFARARRDAGAVNLTALGVLLIIALVVVGLWLAAVALAGPAVAP
jgi:hypothetical protein